MNRFLYIFLALIVSAGSLFSQNSSEVRTLDWHTSVNGNNESEDSFYHALYKEDCPNLPWYYESFDAPQGSQIQVEVINPQFETVKLASDLGDICIDDLPEKLQFYSEFGVQKMKNHTGLYVNPFIISNNTIQRLVSFTLNINTAVGPQLEAQSPLFADNSVLATGDWYRFYVEKTGIHVLTYSDLVKLGMDMKNVNSDFLAVFGNGGSMLPELNQDARYDDLQELAVFMDDGNDGSFDETDRIIFYAQGPMVWKYNDSYHRYQHYKNIYTDKSGYFVTLLSHPYGKRIQPLESVEEQPTHLVSTFTDLYAHENNLVSLNETGKQWYGMDFDSENFQATLSDINFPDLVDSVPVYMKTEVVGRSISDDCRFRIYHAGEEVSFLNVRNILATDNMTFARSKSVQSQVVTHSGDDLPLDIVFEYENPNALGWLDYIELHAVRELHFHGNQYDFRNLPSFGYQRVASFAIRATNSVTVWDITDIHNCKNVVYAYENDSVRFIQPSQELHEYTIFDGSDFYHPVLDEKIENQNLHGEKPVDYLVISHPNFIAQSERLAQLHRDHDGVTTLVVTPEVIYNEFSSGVQDITAIRDFIRMMYMKSNGEKPTSVVLMGDASYDYMNRIEPNTNFVPTFQSEESLAMSSSWDTDDYYAVLDDMEGENAYGLLDVGVGRFPVSTPEEADQMINKIEHYLSRDQAVMHDWKNTMVFVADDEDTNLHFNQAETLTSLVDTSYPQMNINKIYFDAYQRVSVAGGYRFPDAKDAINKAMDNGALIVNYTGHGGETGWSNEKVLEIPDINSWTNYDRLSVLITATCEFSRFDNPNHTSAGEMVVLNPNGGAVSMFTTSRLSFAQSNFGLNQRFYDVALIPRKDGQPTLGEIMMYSKVPSQTSTKNFVILGDPGLTLQLPDYEISTDKINGISAVAFSDTTRALETMSIDASVRYFDGTVNSSFNGVVNVKLYDKASVYSTLGQAPGSEVAEFALCDKLLFEGVAEVVNGSFSIEMLIPKEINYQYGDGKISYYATDNQEYVDAQGVYNEIVIGGYNSSGLTDNAGPSVVAYLNNLRFESGDYTNENPVLLVDIADPCGINSMGNSIGHNITAYFDDQMDQIIELNPYYSPEPGTYDKGSVVYPFENLENGQHSITVKAWDLCNNSTVVTIQFVVSSLIGVELNELKAYPNPLTDYVDFTFNHNMPGRNLDVKLDIFDFMGRNIRNLETTIYCENVSAGPLRWDRKNSAGASVNQGVYYYRIRVRTISGDYTVSGGTLIVN